MRKLTPWGKSKGAELEPTEKKKKKSELNLLPEYQEAFCGHLKINWSKPAQCTASGKQLKHVQGSSLTKGPLEIN